jgi:hypothetical protein
LESQVEEHVAEELTRMTEGEPMKQFHADSDTAYSNSEKSRWSVSEFR